MLESFPPRHRHCLLTPDLVMWVKQMINHPPQTPKIGGMNRSQMGGLYIDVYGIVLPTFDISIDNEADRLTNIT